MKYILIHIVCFAVIGLLDCPGLALKASQQADQWKLHFIHQGPIIRKGADGIDIEDVNGDGYPDVVATWQHASRAIVYVNPGRLDPKSGEWTQRVQLDAGDIEDCKFGDLNGDGAMDVLTASETTRQLFIHWAPSTDYKDASQWERQRIDKAARLWVQVETAQLDGEAGLDVIGGAMNKESSDPTLYWYRAPADPRSMEWKEYLISDQTPSIMSIEPIDMDGDGDLDIVTGARHLMTWLENPSPDFSPDVPWKMRVIDTFREDASFLALANLDQDSYVDIVATDYRDTTGSRIATWYRNHGYGKDFTAYPIEVPGSRPFSGQKNGTKGVVGGDVNGDGNPDLVFTTHVESGSTVFWLEYQDSPKDVQWTLHEIRRTPAGVEEKYDNVQLADMDLDGDLDVVTSEENRLLGVIWFENQGGER